MLVQSNGGFTYTPPENFHGQVTFTYRATDGGLNSELATASIEVTPVNDAPVAADDAFDLNEDQVFTAPLPGVLGNDEDVEGDDLSATLMTAPLNGVLDLQSNGEFSYTPDLNFAGEDSFVYLANDGELDSSPATVYLTVRAGE